MSAVTAETSTPKILLEIFVMGTDENKKSVKNLNEEIQKQMDSHRKSRHRCRILWYMDKGEKTIEEKKEWFLENANCKYYVYANDGKTFSVDSDFVSKTLARIKKLEDSIASMKQAGISVYKKPAPIATFTNFEILD